MLAAAPLGTAPLASTKAIATATAAPPTFDLAHSPQWQPLIAQ